MTSAIELGRDAGPAEANGVAVDPRWAAVMDRDARWDGAFVFAVTSTRIYCRPSCPSRRPRVERVRFFDTSLDARHAGFRSCKRCLPDSPRAVNDNQLLVARTVEKIHRNEGASLDELAAMVGVSRSHLQRTFSEVIGASPLEYVTARKAERLRQELRRGEKVSN